MFAGDHVDQAAGFIGGDIDYSFSLFGVGRQTFVVERQGHAEVGRFAGGRVISHDVAAPVSGDLPRLFLPGGGIALLGADMNLAGRSDEVARMDFGLRRVAGWFQRQSDQLVRVEHDVHSLGYWIEFDQI